MTKEDFLQFLRKRMPCDDSQHDSVDFVLATSNINLLWPHIEAAMKEKNEIIKQLTDGIKQWASEEDGVPEFLWDDFQKAVSSMEAKR